MSVGKAKTSYTSAILGVSLVLFLLGTLGWMVINGRGLSRAFKEDIEVQVDFHDNTREENIQKMKTVLDAQPFVRGSRIITKQDALKMMNELEGENVDELTGTNPLFASIILNLHSEYVNKDSLEKIRQFIMQSNVVHDVSYPTTVVTQMDSNFRKISIILMVISLLLFSVVVILIDNTVRLAMFSNRFLIKTMQMVGATHRFISKPFDQRAIINGLISGVLAVIGLWFVIAFAEARLPELKLLREPALLAVMMIGMVLLGIVISLVSTHRSVVKYLKLQIEDLY